MKFYYILILFALLASCETVIDVEIPREAPKLVVNAQLVPDSTIILHLSESRYILSDYEFKTVNNATLTVLEDGIFKEQLQKTEEDGIYVSQSILQEGKTYTLKAEAPGFSPVEASSFIAPKVPIQNIALDSTLIYIGD